MSEQTQKDIYRAVWAQNEAWRAAQGAWDWDRCPPASTPGPQLLSDTEPCATEVREAEQRFDDALQRHGVSRAQWNDIETQAVLNNWSPPPPEPWKDLAEQARKDIFREFVLAQDRSRPAIDAHERTLVPKQSTEPWRVYHRRRYYETRAQDQIRRQFEDTILRRYGISRAQLDQIRLEASLRKWPLDDPEPARSATAPSRASQPLGASITAGERQRLQSMPYGTGCLNEALRQAPTIKGGVDDRAIIALAEGCVALMLQREKSRR
jgi:hypothetical protein